ncbi:hypothetical protein [Bradyrhizobium sp. sGM-13]|uniref:hypothetical protein n=1 Tax=Bradyrhizobium sp. sGM-13 TaxID=2831781 RepID=UPI001BCB857E|nr:hypothetical protein [Bradyrhizobium sp. sGM-13]
MYDQPIVEVYESATGAFGAVTASKKYISPPGKRGVVRDIEVFLTADAVGTTAVPEVAVGATQGSAEYARWRLGTAVGTGLTAAATPKRARSLVEGNGNPPVSNDFSGHVRLETTYIPADTPFFITGVAGVGGTPAGTGYHRVRIEWF